jgi:carbon-monoxide dehydrogenase large subunit
MAARAWSASMAKHRHFGASAPRKEDARLLRGEGEYIADLKRHGMVHAAVLRSPYAHARIVRIDVEACLRDPHVLTVLTADRMAGFYDVGDGPLTGPFPTLQPEDAESTMRPFNQSMVASDRVRYVGEPVAMVVAEDRYAAEDALSLIEVEYEPLSVVVDMERALRADAPIVHEETNVADTLEAHEGDPSVIDAAPRRRMFRFRIGRHAGMPLETRGVVAEWDRREGLLQVWSSTQVPHNVKERLERMLRLEGRVRVRAPDVGGAFGVKLQIYPEEVLVSMCALHLGRPVKWIEDRAEHFLGSTHGREQIHDVEVAYDDDGCVLGIRDRVLTNTGAYLQNTSTVDAFVAIVLLRGPYRIPVLDATSKLVMTNKTPMNPFRGVGHVQAVFTMERIMDELAAELGIDPVEIRQRNMVGPDELPLDRGGINVWTGKFTYDSGDYPESLRRAAAMVDYPAFRAEQQRARAEGRYVGIGFATYVEETGIGPFEGASIEIDAGGHVTVLSGAGPSGQGIQTTLAQIAADELDVPLDDVTVVTGDTGVIPFGVGSYASRTAAVGGTAVRLAAGAVRARLLEIAGAMLEADPADLRLEDGVVSVAGVPGVARTLREVVAAVRPGRPLPPGIQDYGVSATSYFHPETNAFGYGTQVAIVEVDIESCMVDVRRMAIVGDAGRLINPMIVDGQYHGGMSMGLGGALLEEVVYGDDGQPLNPNFMDYLLPSLDVSPPIEVDHLFTPTPLNPDGIKGVGESGTIGAPAAIANAVADALRPFGVAITETPITPSKLFHLLEEANAYGSPPPTNQSPAGPGEGTRPSPDTATIGGS